MTDKTKVYVDTFKYMKNRQTLEEQYPDTFEDGYITGKNRLNNISTFRKDIFKMEDILTGKALEWWYGE